MTDEDKEKGFTVRDKRTFGEGETEDRPEGAPDKKEPAEDARPKAAQEQPRKEPEDQAEGPLPEINFSNFIFSLSTSALIQLGEIPDPVNNQINKNIPLAKQTIDILGMLQDKTKGNLTTDEENLVRNILYDLRMRFVKARE
jgi:hypothetical protein